jgi:site-specific DNA recombinase
MKEGRPIRCAIYTRKSTEEGLEQTFNTLDAQREACEAYIKSQVGEGWQALAEPYDDGGFSGGNMDRPAVQRLLADVDAGRVDIIVVYKVDRLTRSLMDFARIVERLDARGVSFVSVTQAFNTTSSMGRLTLNVLLSFAQFEREVTGERIRDKIAASKARGIWMGGNLPLGYDLGERRLLVNEAEAEQVRYIFRRYLALGSGVDLMTELRNGEIISKRWTARSGRVMGGTHYSCGSRYYILQNRLYLGEVVHRGTSHPGEHDAIVPDELFAEVQALLASNRRKRTERPRRAAACPLAGLVYDAEGVPMSPSFSYGRGGRLYRYYVSASVLPGREIKKGAANVIRRAPAAPLEKLVLDRLIRLLSAEAPLEWSDLKELLCRVELRERSIHLVFDGGLLAEPHEATASLLARLSERVTGDRLVSDENGELRLICDRRGKFRGGEVRGGEKLNSGGANGELAVMLRRAHLLLEVHAMSPMAPEQHHTASAPEGQRPRRLMAAGLIAPEIQKMILKGSVIGSVAPPLNGEGLPLLWSDQVALIAGNGG